MRHMILGFFLLLTLTLPSGRNEQTIPYVNKLKKPVFNKWPHYGISWPYLESPWKMHSKEYKHAWYWFINSWNRRYNVREFSLQPTPFRSEKTHKAPVISVNIFWPFIGVSTYVGRCRCYRGEGSSDPHDRFPMILRLVSRKHHLLRCNRFRPTWGARK